MGPRDVINRVGGPTKKVRMVVRKVLIKVRVEPDAKRELEREAKWASISVSALVASIIERYMERPDGDKALESARRYGEIVEERRRLAAGTRLENGKIIPPAS